jgi:short-subunit dehydrogenase
MQLSGKIAVITGASMGIGEALTRELVSQGMQVVMSSRDLQRVEAARSRIAAPGQTHAIRCDVTQRDQIRSLVETVLQQFSRIDLWVNNAGYGILDAIGNTDLEKCRDMFETNFFAVMACMQEVIPIMKAQRSGSIINISSVAGHIPVPYMGAYCATKHALNAVGKAARLELKSTGVNVITVCPGRVQTNFGQNIIRGEQVFQIGTALNRGIDADRAARAILRAYIKNKREVVVPWTNRIPIALYRIAPGLVEFGMMKMMR